MRTLVLAGLGEAPGKTALAAGLGQRWQAAGRGVGYVRVVPAGAASGDSPDPDVEFMRASLGLQSAASVAWDGFPPPFPIPAGTGAAGDLLLVELAEPLGPGGFPSGVPSLPAGNEAAVLLVAGYRQGLDAAAITGAVRAIDAAGVIVNAVPDRFMPILVESVTAPLEQDGIVLFGVLPESRPLMGFSVGELAEHLGAEYQGDAAAKDLVVEHLMLGANITDTATTYFVPKEHMAVFTRCDRPDLQLAALNQSVRCLVLTGAGYVQSSVLYRAEDLGVPVLRVLSDTLDTLAKLRGVIEARRFRQPAKLSPLSRLLEAHLRLDALDGLAGA